MKQKRTMTALLFAAMLLCACSNDTTPSTDGTAGQTEAPAVETEELWSSLPNMDWDGRVFHVLGKETSNASFNTFEVYAESTNGEILNDTIFERNTTIENKYNVKIGYTAVEDTSAELRKVVMANEDTYDLSFNWTVDIGSLAADGLMYNLNNLKYVDFSQPWWNQDANETLTIAGQLYFTTSDFLLHDKLRSYIIIYNADLAVAHQLEDLQTIAEEGRWTIDMMNTLGRQVASDLNNDGKMSNEDRFSLIGGATKDMAMFAASLGNKIVSKDENGDLYISMNTEHMVNSIDKIHALYDKSYSAYPEDFSKYDSADFYNYGYNIFYSGNSLFYAAVLNGMKSCSSKCNFDYKALLMPKFDEQQEKYLTQPDDITLLFNVPASVSDPDFCGFMLEALSYISSDTTLPTYYEVCCKNKYTYDERSMKLLDIAMQGVTYDIGFIWNLGGLRDILKDNYATSRKNNFASAFEKREKSALASMEELVTHYEALQ